MNIIRRITAALAAALLLVAPQARAQTFSGIQSAGQVQNSRANALPGWTATPTLGIAGSVLGTLTLSGNTSGTTVLRPSAAASGTLTLPAATDTLVGKATTDVLTNKTIDGNNNTLTVLAGTQLSGQVPVANGGTGRSTLTNHGVLVGATTAAITQLAVGATKSVLQGTTGADPAFTTTPTVATLTVNNNAAASLPAATTGTILQVGGADAISTIVLIDTFGGSGVGSSLALRKANGTAASPSALVLNDPIFSLAAYGYGATGYSAVNRGFLGFFAAEGWTDSAQGTYAVIYTTATGSTTSTERIRVNPGGELLYPNKAAPSSPAAGNVATWTDSTDLRFHDKDSAGNIGTTVRADTGASNNFLTAISAAGVISKAQPSFTNLSGSASCAQMPALTGDVTTSAGSCATTVGNSAWSTYTPTITSTGGTFTTVAGTGRYKQFGKTVLLYVKVTITTAGTATGNIFITLPVSAGQNATGSGQETVLSGSAVTSWLDQANARIQAHRYDAATLIANGAVVETSIVYETP